MTNIKQKRAKKIWVYSLLLLLCCISFFKISAQNDPNLKKNAAAGVSAIPQKQTDNAMPVAEKEVANAETGSLFATIEKGGSMMIPLLLLALLCLTLMLERIIFFLRSKTPLLSTLKKFLAEKNSAIRSQENIQFREDLDDSLQRELLHYKNKMEKGLVLLNGAGNLAPLLGFLGTVTGMISAFSAIASAATVNAKIVASGIQEALITTAAGLMIAVPALAAFHFFSHLVQNVLNAAEEEIDKLSGDLPRLTKDL